MLGNHDHREHFWAAFPEAKPAGPGVPGAPAADHQAAVVETSLANWILLNSLYKTDFTPGQLGKEQLQWLAKTLDARADKPALLVAHHNLEGFTGLQDAVALMQTAVAQTGEGLFLWPHARMESPLREGDPPRQCARDGLALRCRGTAGLAGSSPCTRPSAAVVMNALDKKHAKHGQRVELKWRT